MMVPALIVSVLVTVMEFITETEPDQVVEDVMSLVTMIPDTLDTVKFNIVKAVNSSVRTIKTAVILLIRSPYRYDCDIYELYNI
jgi:hypothetical protein